MNHTTPPADPILKVDNLSVGYASHHGTVHAVRDVSFQMGAEKVGIVGESGSGKSTLGRALLRILPRSATLQGNIWFHGTDLARLTEKQLRAYRGARLSMVLQDPKYSLNPLMRVGEQIAEAYRLHSDASREQARERAMSILEAVQIRNPARVYRSYPHEVSGGMGQRVMIAMMLVAEPELVVADEITSALDATVSMQVLAILDDLVREMGLGLVFISHDLELVATFCERILVMYAGRIVEECRAGELDQARHPYTRGLLGSVPRIDRPSRRLAVLERCPTWAEPTPGAP
ncbi:MAG: ABC transporter ATP-binding protein [Deferrisomatales bacterium]|nr:ABC transporter ATP-binding protein [Deferrisomatales bacterium]